MKQNIYDNDIFFRGYTSLRDSGITYNDFVEQPAIKATISSLTGKRVLELGCGTGHFAKYCIEHGASRVVAVDISTKMIERAKEENHHERIYYICMPIEDLEFQEQSFDVVVSSLAIHYIEDYSGLIEKISRFLKKDGEFIFSTEHPIVTAKKVNNNWVKDSEGNILHWPIDHYHEEGKREIHWYVDGVVVYHRTIATLLNTLIEHGLTFLKLVEPQSTPEGLELMPKLVNEKRRPSFIIIKARK